MAVWTFAREIKPDMQGVRLPDRYHTFVIKRDGVVVGTLAHTYRPKNAGGPAWCATITDRRLPTMTPGCVGITNYAAHQRDALNHLREYVERYADRIDPIV